MIPLTLAATRVPLATGTAGYPQPAERLALHLLLATQMAAAAMLFPFLMRTVTSAAMVIVSAWPFQLATGYLASRPPAEVWPGAAFITLWLFALAAWGAILTTGPLRRLGVASSAGLTVGGAALWYLAADFGPPPSPTDLPPALPFGPLATLLTSLTANSFPPAAWVWPGAGAACAVFLLWVRRTARARSWASVGQITA